MQSKVNRIGKRNKSEMRRKFGRTPMFMFGPKSSALGGGSLVVAIPRRQVRSGSGKQAFLAEMAICSSETGDPGKVGNAVRKAYINGKCGRHPGISWRTPALVAERNSLYPWCFSNDKKNSGMRTSNIKQRDGQTPDTGCETAMGISRHIGRTEEQTGIPGGHGNSTSGEGTEWLPTCLIHGSITSSSASLRRLRRLLRLL